MVTVTKQTMDVPVTVFQTEVTGYTLEMSPDVAKTVFLIVQRIGGDPSRSRRGHCDEIYLALRDAGLTYDVVTNCSMHGTIHFEKNK